MAKRVRTPFGMRCRGADGKFVPCGGRRRSRSRRGGYGSTKGMRCVRYKRTRGGRRCAKYA